VGRKNRRGLKTLRQINFCLLEFAYPNEGEVPWPHRFAGGRH
jgi:hypothetical protein